MKGIQPLFHSESIHKKNEFINKIKVQKLIKPKVEKYKTNKKQNNDKNYQSGKNLSH